MILDEITAAVVKRLVVDKQQHTLEEIKKKAQTMPERKKISFATALSKPGISCICEVKRASPSKGLIARDFPYLDIAKEYEQAGAAAISVLTERDYFQGSSRYLQAIAATVDVPVLRKDFIIDEYQIYEAKLWGAAAILLICAILDDEQLQRYYSLATHLGLDVLVEAHDEQEVIRARNCGARIIGVNNRNLKDFTVSLDTSCRLRRLVPDDMLFVAESGIKTATDIDRLRESGVDAVLIGETMMRSADKKQALQTLLGE